MIVLHNQEAMAYVNQITALKRELNYRKSHHDKLLKRLTDQVFDLHQEKENQDKQKAMKEQIKSMSKLFGVLQQFTDPETAEVDQYNALGQMSDCVTELRQQKEGQNQFLKDINQECQICFETFQKYESIYFASNKKDLPSQKNLYAQMVDESDGNYRVALSCGHDLFHK